MGGNSYPQVSVLTPEKLDLRDLLPIYPPPEPLEHPPLPSPQRQPVFEAPFTLSTHLIPAAYLRTTKPTPVPAPPPLNTTKEERNRILEKTLQTISAAQSRSTIVTDGYPKVLWNCLNRYVKQVKSSSNSELNGTGSGITLFLAHANGFPKEVGTQLSLQET